MWVTVAAMVNRRLFALSIIASGPRKCRNGFLRDFSGYVQTDEYAGYDEVGDTAGIRHAGCWAHVRRKFFEASKVSKNANSALVALGFIAKLYTVEGELSSSDDAYAGTVCRTSPRTCYTDSG